jgi:hypothetical protein
LKRFAQLERRVHHYDVQYVLHSVLAAIADLVVTGNGETSLTIDDAR